MKSKKISHSLEFLTIPGVELFSLSLPLSPSPRDLVPSLVLALDGLRFFAVDGGDGIVGRSKPIDPSRGSMKDRDHT